MTPDERAELISDIALAIKAAEPTLTDDEQRWVRLAIQSEAQSIQMRKAIIEKTLAGLVWAAIIGLGLMFVDVARNHGWR